MNFSTDQFDYTLKTNTFAAEASTLFRASTYPFHQLYPDACDEGITLTSHVTGKVASFYLEETETDSEGDIGLWRLLPTAEAIRANARLATATVIIFND
jgi:hypothetical protein